jgi:hypothetical protein
MSNLAGSSGNIQKRLFLLQGTDLTSSPNPFFVPSLPAAPGSPTAVAFPGTLNQLEQAEVNLWLANQNDNVLSKLTIRAAIAKVNELKTYYADPAIVAWRAAVHEATVAQRILTRADALISNELTQSISSDSAGTGASPPPAYLPPGADTP